MKIAWVLITFNSDHILEPCLRSALQFGQVYAAEGPVTFWQQRGYTTSTDKTNEILARYSIPTIHGQWSEKDDEANAALSLVPDDVNFIWCLDSDEVWKPATVRSILKALESDVIDSVSFKPFSFFGGFDRYMTGFEENFEWHRIQRFYPGARFATHRPPTILAPDGRPWRKHRHINHEQSDKFGWRFFHYSYVFPSQMKAKAEYYAAMGGNIPDYYQNVYLLWVMGNDTTRQVIEREYNGVHNWLPKRRGPCFTAEFKGEHPTVIQEAMPELRARMERELGAPC